MQAKNEVSKWFLMVCGLLASAMLILLGLFLSNTRNRLFCRLTGFIRTGFTI